MAILIWTSPQVSRLVNFYMDNESGLLVPEFSLFWLLFVDLEGLTCLISSWRGLTVLSTILLVLHLSNVPPPTNRR